MPLRQVLPILAVLGAIPGGAATISRTQHFSLSDDVTFSGASPANAPALQDSQVLTFNQFDPALGTLLTVEIDVVSSYSGAVALSVFGPGIGQFSSNVGNLALTGEQLGLFDLRDFLDYGFFCDALADPELICFHRETLGRAFNRTLLRPLSPYLGTGSVDLSAGFLLPLSASGVQLPSPPTTYSVGGNFTWSGDVTLTYGFEIPEPSTICCLAVPLAAFVWRRRRMN